MHRQHNRLKCSDSFCRINRQKDRQTKNSFVIQKYQACGKETKRGVYRCAITWTYSVTSSVKDKSNKFGFHYSMYRFASKQSFCVNIKWTSLRTHCVCLSNILAIHVHAKKNWTSVHSVVELRHQTNHKNLFCKHYTFMNHQKARSFQLTNKKFQWML